MIRRPLTVAAALAAAVCLGAGTGAVVYAALSSDGTGTVVRQVTVADSEPAATSSGLPVNTIYRRAHRGVVEITVATGSGDGTFGNREQQAQGSGFVYDSEGRIITNQHVVDGASSISVRFWNGATYRATLVGADRSTDVALLDVDAPASLLSPLGLGNSGALSIGDNVVAIGSPFGLEQTVTTGIVSALHRQMQSPNGFTIDDSVQTDAAINHGNSGGPLLNAQGRVIGVNSQIESESGGNDGVGFAVPSNTVRKVVSQLLTSGKVEHAYLGVSLETIPAPAASQLGTIAGAAVVEVRSGTPAARAGLRGATAARTIDGASYPTGGDVITAVNGRRITSADALRSAIESSQPGDRITLTLSRGGQRDTVRVILASRPS